MTKSALGRGLGALLGKPKPTEPANPVTAPVSSDEPDGLAPLSQLPLDKIRPCSFQPRKEFTEEALRDLADSIREQGILQPLLVRPRDDFYELIAGERRWRAAQLLGLAQVPVVVREADDKTTLELALVENLQREDLNPIEAALGYAQLIDRFALKQDQVAARVGVSRAAVANTLRLLKLTSEVRIHVRDGRLSVGHAKVILGLSDDAMQKLAADRTIRNGLSVRQAEELVASMRDRGSQTSTKSGKPTARAATPDAHIGRLESALQERYGTKVRLNYRKGKGGSLQIKFFNDEDLERILQVSGVEVD